MQSPVLPESPTSANSIPSQPDTTDSPRRESNGGYAWQQDDLEAYLYLPSPEFMGFGNISPGVVSSKELATEEIPSNDELE